MHDYFLTCGCLAASNWKPGPHTVFTIEIIILYKLL